MAVAHRPPRQVELEIRRVESFDQLHQRRHLLGTLLSGEKSGTSRPAGLEAALRLLVEARQHDKRLVTDRFNGMPSPVFVVYLGLEIGFGLIGLLLARALARKV